MVDIDKILRERGISQAELARRLEMAPQNVSRIIKSDDIKLSVLNKIADALGVSVSSFFSNGDNHFETENREILASQQRTIENLSETIKHLTSK